MDVALCFGAVEGEADSSDTCDVAGEGRECDGGQGTYVRVVGPCK